LIKKKLGKDIKRSLKKQSGSSEEILLRNTTSDLSLIICGGIKQHSDYIRLVFQLLQHPLSPHVINNLNSNSDELCPCQKLTFRTTIISAVSYLLPDSIEDVTAEKVNITTLN